MHAYTMYTIRLDGSVAICPCRDGCGAIVPSLSCLHRGTRLSSKHLRLLHSPTEKYRDIYEGTSAPDSVLAGLNCLISHAKDLS